MTQKISYRLGALVAVFILALVGFIGYFAMARHSQLYTDRSEQIRRLADTAVDVLAQQDLLVKNGTKTLEQAQKDAAEIIRQLRYDGQEYFWINSLDGRMVMHPITPALDGKPLLDLKDKSGKLFFSEMIDVVKKKGGGLVEYDWPKPGSQEAVRKFSYVIGYPAWNWLVGTGVYVDDLEEIFRRDLISLILMAGAIAFGCGLFALFIVRSITRPLDTIVARMGTLEAGDTATPVPAVDRRDEIGRIAQAVDGFRRAVIEKNDLAAAQAAGQGLRERRQQAIDALIGRFRTTVAGLVAETEATTRALDDTAGALAAVAADSAARTQSAAKASGTSAQNVQSIAAAVEELSASIGEISRQIGQTTDVVKRATAGAHQSNTTVGGLSTAAAKIGEVVTLIQAIAAQTNLLALNATIEAARAGEAGRGFAVVASEVKELATQTSKATEEIATQIGAIQAATAEAATAIGAIAETMQDVNGYTTAIATAVTQQGGATGEISVNIRQAAEGSQIVVQDIETLAKSVLEAEQSAHRVTEASQRASATTARLRAEVAAFLDEVAAA